jgi:hypothetical protein
MTRLRTVILACFSLAMAGCGSRPTFAPTPVPVAPDPAPPGRFRDITAESGIDFTYRNGQEAGHLSILESLGGGVALLDYDGDGLLDVFVTGGGEFGGADKTEIRGRPSRLYKNLGGGKFADVTTTAGLDRPLFYSHGAAVADFDNDGRPDLLVTGWGRVVLYHNEGGGKFADVTAKAGLADSAWSTSAAWGDLDGDGFPDLYVCHYVNWSFANNPTCKGYRPGVERDVCPPLAFSPLPHTLYRNNGDGTFTDVSASAGLRKDGKGLGVLMVDVDGDGKPDIYVANDTTDNFLYLNKSKKGEIRLEEVGGRSATAVDDRGVANGSMGVDAADYDGSGRASLWVTNYENESHGLYRNQGKGLFLHATVPAGIGAIGTAFVGFGTGFLDFDNDGWEDLVIAHGHVIRYPGAAGLQQRPVLLRNQGNVRFADVTATGGPYFRELHIGRGLAIGDLDNDGRAELVVSHLNEPVCLLRNEDPSGNHWLGVELAGLGRRDIVGATVVVEVAGRRLTRFTKGGGSYLSSADRRLLFGLGKAECVDRLTVRWPWGGEQVWVGKDLPVDRYHRLSEKLAAR